MAQHALSKEGVTRALDAEKSAKYWCLECQAPMKLRVGKSRLPHFCHTQASTQCRLYSKTEDHLLLQLQLQSLFPKGEIEIEKPFLEINRVADLYWSREKIVFEIQCSPIALGEAQHRHANYQEIHCDVIWLLDDRIFNKRIESPPEAWIRSHGGYYISFSRNQTSLCYDQLEVILHSKRLKKGRPLPVDLRFPRKIPNIEWSSSLPSCIKKRPRYFRGDLLDRAIRQNPSISYWYALEKKLLKEYSLFTRVKKFLYRYIVEPYDRFTFFLIKKLESKK